MQPKAYSDDPCTQNKCEDVVELHVFLCNIPVEHLSPIVSWISTVSHEIQRLPAIYSNPKNRSNSWKSRNIKHRYAKFHPRNTCRHLFEGCYTNWVCLKIGYIPNYSHLIGIMISKTIGFRGTHHFQTHPITSQLVQAPSSCSLRVAHGRTDGPGSGIDITRGGDWHMSNGPWIC